MGLSKPGRRALILSSAVAASTPAVPVLPGAARHSLYKDPLAETIFRFRSSPPAGAQEDTVGCAEGDTGLWL